MRRRIRSQRTRPFWLRRDSARCQSQPTRGQCGSLTHIRMTFAFTTPRRFNRRTGERFMKTRIALVALILSTCALLMAAQQDQSKRPSPPAQAQCKFTDGKTIKTDYSSPRVKGRKIFGGLVPYGQVWRTGANDATTLV